MRVFHSFKSCLRNSTSLRQYFIDCRKKGALGNDRCSPNRVRAGWWRLLLRPPPLSLQRRDKGHPAWPTPGLYRLSYYSSAVWKTLRWHHPNQKFPIPEKIFNQSGDHTPTQHPPCPGPCWPVSRKVHQILSMTLSLFLAGDSLWSPTVIPQHKCLVGPPWKTTESGNSTREGTGEILYF